MAQKNYRKNCYCETLWENHPEELEKQGIPFGFCGICGFCGDFGHLRHYPGPVPCSGVWCDVCYKVESHFSPNREIGVWSYDSETEKESNYTDAEAFDFKFLSSLLASITNPKSALVINLPSKISIDFQVKPSKCYEFRYNDYDKPYFIYGDVDFNNAGEVLHLTLQNKNLKYEFDKLGLELKYIEE